MHKNIRRSIAVAATATGMWALGTAAASADELPVSLPLSTPDHAVDAADVVNGVDGAEEPGNLTNLGNSKGLGSLTDNIKDTVRTKATGARGEAEAKAAEATSAAKGATAAEPARRAAAVQDQVAGAADKVTGTLHDAISRSDVLAPQGILDEQVLQGVPAAPEAPIDYLFGPIEQIPGYADYAQTTGPGALTTAQGIARSTAGSTTGTVTRSTTQAEPVVGRTTDAVLPPAVADAVSTVLPAVGRALGDVSTLVRGVVAEVTPFAEGVVQQAAVPFVQGVANEVQPMAQGVTGAVQPFAAGVTSEVQPLAQGPAGDAVAPFAQGVTGRVMPPAHGVGAQAQPFAGGLVGTVGDDVRPAVGNAAHGAEGLTSITPAYVTDATGSVPSFGAPEYPARSI
ncbi:hypothetical protein [Streptomyces sp. Ncost-T10-10d]|uniref:hypothetical protein n=1 Tax=Streptomyces sp. Ncost-T10-10d TaxID=1839774 RepID=UPI00081E6020|nr:hypothetical protein [Streptomyces sp. Ncost-T10-10d]SCF64596.1 hypothetical protein GA0115254_10908 [Streptomyces sp. Ncost-T10-10d]